MNAQTQLLPFPLPEYLADYVAHQIKSPIVTSEEGKNCKVFHITNYSILGKLIHKCLTKSNKPQFEQNGITLYISVSEYAGDHNPIPRGHRHFLKLNKEEINDIILVFEKLFNDSFTDFVSGAEFGHYYASGYKKGVVHKAINKFLEIYKISPNHIKFDTLAKRYQRYKSSKVLKKQLFR